MQQTFLPQDITPYSELTEKLTELEKLTGLIVIKECKNKLWTVRFEESWGIPSNSNFLFISVLGKSPDKALEAFAKEISGKILIHYVSEKRVQIPIF